jgi:hypothetical protein
MNMFIGTALAAEGAGFNGVQVHAAHGLSVCQIALSFASLLFSLCVDCSSSSRLFDFSIFISDRQQAH